jgi:anthranilate phosphoribosyltransferase
MVTPAGEAAGPCLGELLVKLAARQDLTATEAEAAFAEVMEGRATPVLAAALLTALRVKGEAPAEVAGGVRALRRAMVPVPVAPGAPVVDTCGTGGGALTTFNISTGAALLAAGAGARIAKHGNRSFTSRCGSADVLEALGVVLELTPEGMGQVLEEAGIVFMFAPLLHPAMRHVGPVRRELGFTTIMNLLGPLTNPAGARRQVVGVTDASLLPLAAGALAELGHEHALVVHGHPGMDELSPLGPSRVLDVRAGRVEELVVDPPEGVPPDPRAAAAALHGGGPEDNARILLEILDGVRGGPARDAVVLNAGAALYVAGAASLREGIARAAAALDAGQGRAALERLRNASRTAGRLTR